MSKKQKTVKLSWRDAMVIFDLASLSEDPSDEERESMKVLEIKLDEKAVR